MKADRVHDVDVRDRRPGEESALHAFLVAQGWGHRLGDVAHFQRVLAASQRVAVAEADGRIVGFARALTDGLSNGYLSMVAVASGFRRRGVGRALVQRVMGDDPAITWVLRAGRDGAPEFFARLGFEPSTTAMERRRQP